MKTFILYTDGACSGNPGPGGWCAILISEQNECNEYSGGAAHTTNNQMELTAVIEGLKRAPGGSHIILYSDSQYVLNGLQKGWAKNWKANGWIKSNKKPALNPELWNELLDLTANFEMEYHWVHGHATDEFNNRCDRIAVAESQAQMRL